MPTETVLRWSVLRSPIMPDGFSVTWILDNGAVVAEKDDYEKAVQLVDRMNK